MMWGGVASRAAARRAPRSTVAGSTLPSQSQAGVVVATTGAAPRGRDLDHRRQPRFRRRRPLQVAHRLGHRPRRHAPHAVAQIGQRVLRRGLGAAARLRIAAQHERDRHDDAEADEHGHALVDLGGAFGLRGGFVGEATGAAATSFLLRCERGDKA